jgi:hypothetical protein
MSRSLSAGDQLDGTLPHGAERPTIRKNYLFTCEKDAREQSKA